MGCGHYPYILMCYHNQVLTTSPLFMIQGRSPNCVFSAQKLSQTCLGAYQKMQQLLFPTCEKVCLEFCAIYSKPELCEIKVWTIHVNLHLRNSCRAGAELYVSHFIATFCSGLEQKWPAWLHFIDFSNSYLYNTIKTRVAKNLRESNQNNVIKKNEKSGAEKK